MIELSIRADCTIATRANRPICAQPVLSTSHLLHFWLLLLASNTHQRLIAAIQNIILEIWTLQTTQIVGKQTDLINSLLVL